MRDATELAGDQTRLDTHTRYVVGKPLDLAGDHTPRDTHGTSVAGNTFAPGQVLPDTQSPRAGGDQLDRGHGAHAAHDPFAPVDNLPAATLAATPSRPPPPATLSPPAKPPSTPIKCTPGASSSRTTNPPPTPRGPASSASDPAPGHSMADTQVARAGGGVPVPHDALLALLANAVDDLEDLRKATTNRLRALTALPVNDLDTAKGITGGPTVARATAMLDAIIALEAQAIKDLERAMRAHPLGSWAKGAIGVGPKQLARLLAALGDPAARATPSQLWQYAGHGDPARSKLRKGQPVEHSPTAKMRTRLIAESCIKQAHSPYRAVYDQARAAAVGKVHSVQCQNTIRPSLTGSNGSNGCGTREHPEWGAPGSPWRPGHEHGHALRLVGKAVLLDLWRAARATQDLTGASSGPTPMVAAPRSDCLPAPSTPGATPKMLPAGPGELPAARQGAA